MRINESYITANGPTPSLIEVNDSYEGEPIEKRVARMLNNKEPFNDMQPLIYTARKDGVNPLYDIRTDRFDLALESTEEIYQLGMANRKLNADKWTEDNEKQAETASNDATPQNGGKQ